MRHCKHTPEWQTGCTSALPGSGYTAEETEFLRAMTRWQDRHPGKRPDCRDVLRVAKGLGYRKEKL